MAKKFHPSDLKWFWPILKDGTRTMVHEDGWGGFDKSLLAEGEADRIGREIKEARRMRLQLEKEG